MTEHIVRRTIVRDDVMTKEYIDIVKRERKDKNNITQ